MINALRSFRPAVCAVVLWSALPSALAQVDCGVAAKANLDAADVAALKKLLADQAPRLRSADPAASEEGRDAILKPLKCNQVSLDFRLNMSGPAFAELSKAVTDTNDHVAFNAIRVFGELGTQQAVEAIKPALSDPKRPAVRCMAAMAMRDIIRSAPQTSAIRDLNALLDVVSQRLATETDVNVVENLVLALDATRGSDDANAIAMQKMSSALTKQIVALRDRPGEAAHDRWAKVLIRGTDGAFQPMMNAGGTALSSSFRIEAAMLSGQALAYVRDRLVSGLAADSDEARSLSTLVNTSERALVLIDSGIRKVPAQKQVLVEKFDEALKAGSAAAFETEAAKWIGNAGTLTKAPYNAKAADFAS